jgi:hypothetical protein
MKTAFPVIARIQKTRYQSHYLGICAASMPDEIAVTSIRNNPMRDYKHRRTQQVSLANMSAAATRLCVCDAVNLLGEYADESYSTNPTGT